MNFLSAHRSSKSSHPSLRVSSAMCRDAEGGRPINRGRRAGITLAGKDVENDIGGVDAVGDRLGTSRLDRRNRPMLG